MVFRSKNVRQMGSYFGPGGLNPKSVKLINQPINRDEETGNRLLFLLCAPQIQLMEEEPAFGLLLHIVTYLII